MTGEGARFASLATILFADDSSLSLSNTHYDLMVSKFNAELDRVYEWTISNRLSLNLDKTHAMIFSNRRYDVSSGGIKINDRSLEFVNTCNYLGVIIDNKLSFRDHIQHVAN